MSTNFSGIREKRPNASETPDARNQLIGNRLKTRPGIKKVQNRATGKPIMEIGTLKSDDCVTDFNQIISGGKLESLPYVPPLPPPPFGDVIRSASSLSGAPAGIGGDAKTIWCSEVPTDRIHELSLTDFSVIRSAASPSTLPIDIGGDANTIWHCDWDASRIHELSPTDFSVIKSAASPSTLPAGIGGDANIIWHCDYGVDRIHELSPTDFSVIRSAASPFIFPAGIGGDAKTIWHCDTNADRIYELSTG